VLLHRKIGERLEALYGESPGAHLPELAHHFFQAAPGGDVVKAIDYAVRAAERAASDCAYEEAIEHYGRAIQALDLTAGDNAERRCELLVTLAETHTHAGTVEQGREPALEAAAIARAHGWRESLALAAIHMNHEFAPNIIADPERADLVDEALARFQHEDDPLALRLLCRRAMEDLSSDPEQARVFAARALEMAKRIGESEALARACYAAHAAHSAIEHLEKRLELTSALIESAGEAGFDSLLSAGYASRFFDLLEGGDAQGAKRDLAAHNAIARRTREPFNVWQACSFDCLVALLEGRFEEAERLTEEGVALANRFEHTLGPTVYAIQKSRVRAERGELEENLAQVKAVNEIIPSLGWQSRIAQICAELGREAEAREEFEKLAVDDFGTIPRDLVWLLTIAYCAEVASFLKDTERATTLYTLLLPHASRNVVVVSSACNGSVSRHLGLLATTLGQFDDAERHYEDALAMAKRLESPPLAARAQCDYADLLLERAGSGDVERARKLSGESLGTARRLGMKILAERALGLKLRAQGVDGTDTEHSIYAVASQVERNQPDLGAHAAPDGTVTLMFSDMEGFTVMTERLGDVRAREVIRDHNRIVREQVQAHGGYEVELQGDGFLMAFGSARSGLQCAIGIQQAFTAHSEAHPEEPIRVRIGLHTGEALREADKFFGRTVILAARIAAQAEAGEILVSSLVRELTQSLGEIRFGDARQVDLKGIAETQQLVSVLWS
jgi:class 3 adenylate cyclase